MAKIKFYQKELSRKSKNSKNFDKTKLKFARTYLKLTNCRKDHLHKTTNYLVKEGGIIFAEDLSTKNLLEKGNHKLAKSIGDAIFGELMRQLEYKCKWYRNVFIKINRFYPSSQICSNCGHQDNSMKNLSKRDFRCPVCGNVMDRDFNASINIMVEGLRKLVSSLVTI